ncbi:cysteine-rich motor neuron 1 protein-like [Gigantopelta aegis]|uniref:cysteine-rich motor neuron 1 protein-like n=1 Tax=Gigantopelta aegis TaxID=1735272 RepID=UPI001B88B732|nr:cysteine-rich motor neuron 1 protein-like [Gigantopelta aegis]
MPATVSGAVPLGTLCVMVTVLVLPSALAINCGVCDPDQCLTPRECRRGSTIDLCGCCSVCAKEVNQSCGGKYGLLGKCGEGLQCFISPPIGRPISGQEEGVCKEIESPKNCTNNGCLSIVSEVTIQCPSDSDLLVNATGLADRSQCQCNTSYCTRPTCAAGFHSVLLNEGDGTPGLCCDEFVCRRTAACRSVICPPKEDKGCPPDSERLPHRVTDDGCCYITQGCTCKPKAECPTVSCPLGTQIQMLSRATAMPGSCCENFQCVNDTGLKCSYDGREFRDGESWQIEKCTKCTCRDGLTFCKTKMCNAPLCGWMVIPDGECCPVCKGCVSDSGQLYNNSDVWKENPCVTCQCDAGQVLCQAEMCAVRCSNPRQVPGQCCPVCDDTPPVDRPVLCPSSQNCSLTCAHGLEMSDDDCFLCKCKKEVCTLDCKYGQLTDNKDTRICECAQPQNHCPGLDDCTKRCSYGFKKSRNGCLKCRCNKCPPFNCTKRCLYGYLLNDQGCQLCKCQEALLESTIPSISSELPDSVSEYRAVCLSASGQRHDDGESWHDGCRLCYCHTGTEMCSLIACPVPRCNSPVFRLGDCCPSCPGVTILASGSGEKEACQSSSGHQLVEGETWHMDQCTQCICHDGAILCESHTCPPALCHHPIRPVDKCCSFCKGLDGIPIIPVFSPRPCKTHSGMSYKHDDVWKTNPCQSCTCRHGQIHCYSQMCPIVTCHKTVLTKGECCPSCLDDNSKSMCVSNNISYSPGETWLSDNCTQCVCTSGHIVCVPVTCPMLTCSVLIRKSSQCCPVCLDTSTSKLLLTEENQWIELVTTDEVTRYTEGPTEDFEAKERYIIGIASLGVLLSVALIAVLVLVLVMFRRRHTGMFKMVESPVVTDIRIRPKSTNLELQGVNPFLMDSPSKPLNCESKNLLEKPLVSLGPPVIPSDKMKLADLASKQYQCLHSTTDPLIDKPISNGNCMTNNTYDQV